MTCKQEAAAPSAWTAVWFVITVGCGGSTALAKWTSSALRHSAVPRVSTVLTRWSRPRITRDRDQVMMSEALW